MVVVIPITSSVSAGSDISLPAGIKLVEIGAAYRITMSDGTAAGACTALTVADPGTASPAAGEISLYNTSTVRCGDDLTTRDILVIVGVAPGEVQGYGDRR